MAVSSTDRSLNLQYSVLLLILVDQMFTVLIFCFISAIKAPAQPSPADILVDELIPNSVH